MTRISFVSFPSGACILAMTVLVAMAVVSHVSLGFYVTGFSPPRAVCHRGSIRLGSATNQLRMSSIHLKQLQDENIDNGEPTDAKINNKEFSRRFFLGTSATTTVASAMTGAVSPASAQTKTTSTTPNLGSSSSPNTTPRIVLWGYGNQNKLMAKYLHERKMNVVAVISHHDVGEDYGLVDSADWGNIGSKTGIKIVDEAGAAAELERTKPNICLLCTRSTLADIQPSLMVCANAQVNVITIAEELLNSRTSSPKLTNEMDQLFQRNGVTLTASGFIDGACCEMTMVMASMMHKITSLQGGLQYNADSNGPVLANAHGVGLTKQEFAKFAKSPGGDKSYVYNSNEWFVSALGLTLQETKETRKPIFSTVPLYSTSIGRDIPVGECTGMEVVCTTKTKEGVTIVSKQIGRLYDKNNKKDQDQVSWHFQGEPAGVGFSMDNPPTAQMTNTVTISRIPQVLAAPPGYITTDQLDFGKYKHFV